MSEVEKLSYERHLDALRIQNDVISNAKAEGWDEGLAQGYEDGYDSGYEKGVKQGMEKGVQQGMERGIVQGVKSHAVEMARLMLIHGEPLEKIMLYAGLSQEEIELLKP